MSDHLQSAKTALDRGDLKRAVSDLWTAEADARTDVATAEELLKLATAIRDRTDGGLKRDCDQLIEYATRYIDRGDDFPSLPPKYRVGMPISTSNDVPGYEVIDYVGEVFGLVVRSRGAIPQVGAAMKSWIGGEIGTMTTLLRTARREAIERMVAEADDRGADGIIAMRVDVTSMGAAGPSDWTEICAYGTAVRMHRRPDLQ